MAGVPIIDVDDLSVHFKTYEGRHRVLDSVDLTINEGETVALVGETGCGKSVTAKSIMGTLKQPPAEIVQGSISFRGEELLDDPEFHSTVQSNHMSMIFQDPMSHLSPVFPIGEMMTDVLRYHDRRDVTWWELMVKFIRMGDREERDELREQCIELLGHLQIPDAEGVLNRYPGELSGGMRQRVLIAMALMNEPDFLVADEPTTALDVTVQRQILDLLKERIIETDLSMLYITHDLGVAREIADRTYVMYAGMIAETGDTVDLFDNPFHPYSKGLIQSIPKLTEFESTGIDGQIPDYTQPPAGCRFHPRCPAFIEGTCDGDPPPGYSIDDRRVHCYLYEGDPAMGEAVSIAESEIDYDGAQGRRTSIPPGSADDRNSNDTAVTSPNEGYE